MKNKKQLLKDILQGDLEDERIEQILALFGYDKDGNMPKNVVIFIKRLLDA